MTDPRQHRHVTAVDGSRLTYRCGCVNAVDPSSSLQRNVSKCAHHRSKYRDPSTLDESYYAELGIVRDGRLAPTKHVAELVEALGSLPLAPPLARALELGCGVSPYVDMIRNAGYDYTGLDPSPWVCEWMTRAYRVFMRCAAFEAAADLDHVSWDFILAAHCFEHMDDAPAAIARCAGMLRPGAELWIIVPDDSDPLNPDHIYFFTPDTLRRTVTDAGLTVEAFAIRRIVAHENFMFCRARKPA